MKRIINIIIILILTLTVFIFIESNIKYEKFIDLISITEYNKEDKIQSIIKLNYESNINYYVEYDTIEENQKQITEIRENNYNYYTNKNLSFLETMDIEKFNIDISNYSPFIFITFDNYWEYLKEKNELIKLSKRDDVELITSSYLPQVSGEADRNTSKSTETITIDEAHEMINVHNSEYTGSGIKIGVVDEGKPDNLDNFVNEEIKSMNASRESDHTTNVISLLGGTYGVAPESDLYIHSFEVYDHSSPTNQYNLKNSIESLLSKGVNVINMSLGNKWGGQMDYYAAYLDHIIWNNHVIIVKSTGNEGGLITSPGCGLNMITVGSIDADKNISFFSNYDVDSNYANILMKPTLVAPGENMIIPNTDATVEAPAFGTSLSTPLVTGTIALLLEEYPNLMLYPEVIISALINGATPLPSQTNHWDEHAGAGLLNYEGAREAIEQSTYSNQTITATTNLDNVLLSEVIDIEPNETAEFSFLNIVTQGAITPHNTTMIPVFSKFDVKVYDSNGAEVNVTKYGENSNTIVGTITNTHTSTVRYRVKVTIRNSKVSAYDEKIMLMIYYHNSHVYEYLNDSNSSHSKICFCGNIIQESHQHSNSYVKLDNTYHKAFCVCGHTVNEGHVVTSSNLNYCIKCCSTIISLIPGPLNNIHKTHTTVNGSYILSTGLTVLVDDDIETYLLGTLQFNKCNVNTEIK